MIKLAEQIHDYLDPEDFIDHFLPLYKTRYVFIKDELLEYLKEPKILKNENLKKGFYETIDKVI